MVLCNVNSCAYNGEGNFCRLQYTKIFNGYCKWLINNQQYYQPFDGHAVDNIVEKDDIMQFNNIKHPESSG